MLDFFRSLLKPNAKRDQIFLLLFEPDMGELFYALLFHTGYPVVLREKALQVLVLLLTTDKVARKDKVQVLLQERDMFCGLVSLIQNSEIFVSSRMLCCLVDIALLTGDLHVNDTVVSCYCVLQYFFLFCRLVFWC